MKKIFIVFTLLFTSLNLFAGDGYTVVSETMRDGVKSKTMVRKWKSYECTTSTAYRKYDHRLHDMNMSAFCSSAYNEKPYKKLELNIVDNGNYTVDFECRVTFEGEEEAREGQCGVHWYPGTTNFSYNLDQQQEASFSSSQCQCGGTPEECAKVCGGSFYL